MYKPHDGYDSEEAIAYGWFVITIFLLIAAAIILTIWAIQGALVPMYNADVAAGKVSSQTGNAVSFNSQMLTMLPVWTILGVFVFAIVRALSRRASQ